MAATAAAVHHESALNGAVDGLAEWGEKHAVNDPVNVACSPSHYSATDGA